MDDDGNFLAHMWQNSSRMADCSLILLALMFFWTTVDTTGRGLQHYVAIWQSRGFLKAIAAMLELAQWESIRVMAEMRKRSHVARVILSALRETQSAHEFVSARQLVGVAKRAARIAANRVHEELRQGLSALNAIATTAPFVGLIGTAIGVLDSFRGFAGSKSAYLAFIATNLADALVPAAVGLLVAVFAMWCFNWRSDRLAVINAEMEIASLELLRHLEREHDTRGV